MVEGDNYSPQNYQGISQMPQLTSKKSGKIIWIIFGVLVILAIAIGVILLNPFSNKISSSDLSFGINVDLKENAKINFETNEEKHKITIDSINVDSVDIIIRSEIIIANLNIGETKKFDLNGDRVYDLSIELKDITDGKANLFIQEINETICTEDWNCTGWGNCVDSEQTRACVDSNDCGVEDKPDEEQSCVEDGEDVPMSELENKRAEVLEKARSVLPEEMLLDFEAMINEATMEELIELEESIDDYVSAVEEFAFVACGEDMDCFISEVCNLANVTSSFSVNIIGWVQTQSNYLEMRGMENDKCLYYSRLDSVSGEYDVATRQTFLDQEMTEEEIDIQEQGINVALEDAIGYATLCKYPIADLTQNLNYLKEGTFSGSTEDFETYECVEE